MTTARPAHPPQGQWTLEAFDALPEEGPKCELVDGALVEMPPARSSHQKIAGLLFSRLYDSCPSRYDVILDNEILIGPTHVRRPDVLVVTAKAAERNDYRWLPEEMLLAVEIVSPGTEKSDRETKPKVYASVGIPNYWRIEQEPVVTVFTYRLDPIRMKYWPSGHFDDVVKVDRPWEIELPVAEITPR
jgi:Uma2 family endonuclease